MWAAGIDAQTAYRRLFADGLPVQQVLALHSEGIAPPLSDGWL